MRTLATFRRTLSLFLIIALLSNQALALTEGFTGVLEDNQHSLLFWWHSSGWATKFNATFRTKPSSQSPRGWDGKGAPAGPRQAPQVIEKKEDRERKVVRVEVFPGDITLQTGQQAVFTAVARDREGAAISGLDVRWEGLDEEKQQAITVSQQATFAANAPGKFKLTADIAGHKAHAKVTVMGPERVPNSRSSKQESVSSQDQPKSKKISFTPLNDHNSRVASLRSSKLGNGRQPLRAAANALAPGAALFLGGEDDYGWNSGNYTSIDDPGTERGNMLGHGQEGSGNFQFAAPLLGLDGRGINLNLAFSYNSRLWHKSGSEMYFDPDRDWVPG